MSEVQAADVPAKEHVESAQERFDRLYITSTEISKRLNINRTSILHARKNGKLPAEISVNGDQLYLWERETAEPYLARWEQALGFRRGEAIA